jgi:hypothetical protein
MAAQDGTTPSPSCALTSKGEHWALAAVRRLHQHAAMLPVITDSPMRSSGSVMALSHTDSRHTSCPVLNDTASTALVPWGSMQWAAGVPLGASHAHRALRQAQSWPCLVHNWLLTEAGNRQVRSSYAMPLFNLPPPQGMAASKRHTHAPLACHPCLDQACRRSRAYPNTIAPIQPALSSAGLACASLTYLRGIQSMLNRQVRALWFCTRLANTTQRMPSLCPAS